MATPLILTMLIKILKTTVCAGETVYADSEITTGKREGEYLIRIGKAEKVREKLTLKPVQEEKKPSKRKSKKED